MVRRVFAHALLLVGAVLSIATSNYEIKTQPRTPSVSAAVSSEPVLISDSLALDGDQPALLRVTVRPEGEFAVRGEGLGAGQALLGVELEGDWPNDYGAFVLWEVDEEADACTRGAGDPFGSGVAWGALATVAADVRADRTMLVAVRMAGESMFFRGALRVYAGAEITADGRFPIEIDTSGITPTVEAELIAVDCTAADTGADTAD